MPSIIEEAERVRKADFEFYTKIWNERGHYSEISGKYLGNQLLSIYFHHLLRKEKACYPHLRHEPLNILVLSPEEHQAIELNPSVFNEALERIQKMKDLGIV